MPRTDRHPVTRTLKAAGKAFLALLTLIPLAAFFCVTWFNGTRTADPAAPSPAKLLLLDFTSFVIAIPAVVLSYRAVTAFFRPRPDGDFGRGSMPAGPRGPGTPPPNPTGVPAPLVPRRPSPLAAHARPA